MTWSETVTIDFTAPLDVAPESAHHAQAAAGNAAIADAAIGVLRDALSGDADIERLLLRAAAGAGKSYVLRRLVGDILGHPDVERVAITAFTNKQTYPLARELANALRPSHGPEAVVLLVADRRRSEVPPDVESSAVVVTSTKEIPHAARVVIAPIHKLGSHWPKQFTEALGPGSNGDAPFDVLFVDEAWQVAHYLFDKVTRHAPIWVGVGDVGQIPPLEIGQNPWRGDAGYNPYRAWPTEFENGDARTWVEELPSVWRPTTGQLALWRAFYPDWSTLDCVVAPGDRVVQFGEMSPAATAVWAQVASGVPTLLEVDGLPDPDAPDVDVPLMNVVESLLDELLASGLSLRSRRYDGSGSPTTDEEIVTPGKPHSDPIIAVLATRNQAVDDAAASVERLAATHELLENDVVSSTVDSWQGQTNGITVAVHPLSGAVRLDDFNSQFGRLAVTCTRATHGLLVVSRPGLDTLLSDAPARPGTPIGEPGFRTLPRQTHQRILATFARGTLVVAPNTEGD
jgi:hypothetical protein